MCESTRGRDVAFGGEGDCHDALSKPLSHYFDYSVASMTMFGHVNVNDNVWSRKRQ